MNKIFYLSLTLLFAFSFQSMAQGFTNYKAVVSDNAGSILTNQNLDIRFTIYDGDPGTTGVQIFQETHNTTTDDNGIVVVNIGEIEVADWFNIDWSGIRFYLQTEYNIGSGFVDMGTQVFHTVPYAQYAHKSQYSIYSQHASEVDFSDITNVPAGLSDGDDDTHLSDAQIAAMGYIKNANDADHDATNELQNLTLNSTQLSISNGNNVSFSGWDTNASDDFDGNFSSLSNVPAGLSDGDDDTHLTDTQIAAMGYIKNANDADHDATNELQNLTLNSTQLSISNGNNVSFSGWDTNASDDFSGNYSDLTGAPTNVSNFTNDANYLTTATLPDQTDADFYKVGTTDPSQNINDNIFHMGKMIIGSNSPGSLLNGKVEIVPSDYEYAIRTNQTTGFTGGLIGNMRLETEYNGDFGYIHIHNKMSGAGTGYVYGMLTNIMGYSGSSARHIAISNLIQSGGTGNKTGVYSRLTSSGGIIKGIHNNIQSSSDEDQFGTYTEMNSTGDGVHTGTTNFITGNSEGEKIGTNNSIDSPSETTTSDHIGTRNTLFSHSNNVHYGTQNGITTSGTGKKYGNYNTLVGIGTGANYGTYNFLEKIISSPGVQYGTYNKITGSSTSDQYGVFNELDGSGNGSKYGTFAVINPSAGGTHYAIYGDATKAGSFAGFFVGDARVHGGELSIYRNSNTNKGQLELAEDQAGDGARLMFTNLLETNNKWTLYGRADNTANDSYFNIHHTTAGNVLVVRGNGKVGIKRNPITNTLEVNGTASKSTAGSWLGNSDRRLKTNIHTIDQTEALNKILALRGVTYEWNDNKTGNKRPRGIQYGFIAQELMEVFPGKVSKDNLGYYQTAYGDYDPLFVQAFKELSKQIKELKHIVIKQQELIEKLSKKLEELEREE